MCIIEAMGENIAEFTRKTQPAQDHAPLFVSLYIVLLAFFIMLNTIATYEDDKAEEILDAVKQRFSFSKPLEFKSELAVTDLSGKALKEFSDAIKAHSSRYLALDVLDLHLQGKRVEIRLPLSSLFNGDDLSSSAKTFLSAVANTSMNWREGYAVNASFLKERQTLSPLEYYQQGSSNNAKELLTLTRFMEQTALPRSQFSVGFTESKTDDAIILRFDIYSKGGAE